MKITEFRDIATQTFFRALAKRENLPEKQNNFLPVRRPSPLFSSGREGRNGSNNEADQKKKKGAEAERIRNDRRRIALRKGAVVGTT